MKNVVQYAAILGVCAVWLASPVFASPVHAAQDESKKSPAKAAPAKAAAKNTPAKKGGDSEVDIKAKLDTMAQQLVVRASATVSPSKMKKAVSPEGSGYVARYTEVDTTDIVTELIQSTGKGGKYIGSIKYREMQYECRGKSQNEALNAPCEKVKVRRMNELVRYDGKWVF